MYTGSFKVSTPEAGRYSISVSGSYGEGYDRYGASDRVEISVEAIHVWARVVDVLPYKTTLELAFSEAAGAPIEGGEVDLEWRYYPATWYQPGHVGGKTDASGRLTLQVRHPDMDEEVPNVVLDGIIRRGNVTQTFQ